MWGLPQKGQLTKSGLPECGILLALTRLLSVSSCVRGRVIDKID
jgi:hypothetical protein